MSNARSSTPGLPGHDYHVYVSLPASYGQGDRRYPVLYVPDFKDAFLILKVANDLMSIGNMLEEFILVRVPLKSEGVRRERAFDLTPTEVEAQNKSLSQRFGGEVHTGGAPMFLRTLKEELIPYIESKYRVTSDRGLAGYSLWWDNGMILKTEADLAKSGKALHGRVFLSVGAEEGVGDNDMVGSFKNLSTAITSHAYPNLQLESHIFESTDHLSGVPGTMSRGLKFLYALQQPKQ